MYSPIHIAQGIRYFASSVKQKIRGPARYKGNAEEICRKIVQDCWNGRYFQASTHHYREFWARDFGYCAESLVKLGHLDEVRKTLACALQKYSKNGIKTTISRHGTPFSFPNVYSPDSVALIFHALRIAKDEELVETYETFLQNEIDTFANIVLEDGKVRRNTLFSGMRDYAKRDSSCYDHCMAILLAREARKLDFQFPYTEKELVKNLNDYWNEHYCDDRSTSTASGDANALPYWLGVGKDFKKSLACIQRQGLDKPFPLAYSGAPQKMISAGIFVPEWEDYTFWPFIGLIWAHAVKKYKPKIAKEYKKEYSAVIEQYGTLYEVYTNDKKPYRSFFYHADEGMLWAAMYLTL